MPDTLYKVPLPDVTTTDERDDLGTILSEQGVLDGDALVEALSSEAADLTLRGEIALGSYYSTLVADELEELAGSSLRALPLFSREGSTAKAGYYEVDDAEVEPVHGGAREVYQYQLSLSKVGTRKTHLRAVETSPSQPDPGHEFGNETDALVGLPAAARRVEAVDSTTAPEQRERPGPVETREGAHGDVDIYDLDAIDIDAPVIVYKLAYEREAETAVHVYDTRGRDAKYVESEDGRVRTWETVFATDHERGADAEAIIENGLLRVRIDEPDDGDETAALEAEEWDAGAEAGEWATVGLHLDRGAERVWFREVAGSIPSSLMALLEPIASTTIIDTGVTQSIVARNGLYTDGGV